MSKRTGNRDARAAKKRAARHRRRNSIAWHARHLVIERPDGDFDVWPIFIDECVSFTEKDWERFKALPEGQEAEKGRQYERQG